MLGDAGWTMDNKFSWVGIILIQNIMFSVLQVEIIGDDALKL
jgi:hypothetical protein